MITYEQRIPNFWKMLTEISVYIFGRIARFGLASPSYHMEPETRPQELEDDIQSVGDTTTAIIHR